MSAPSRPSLRSRTPHGTLRRAALPHAVRAAHPCTPRSAGSPPAAEAPRAAAPRRVALRRVLGLVQAARAAPSRAPSAWACSWATSASRTRGSTASTSSPGGAPPRASRARALATHPLTTRLAGRPCHRPHTSPGAAGFVGTPAAPPHASVGRDQRGRRPAASDANVGAACACAVLCRPENQPTSERAIPVSIFSAEPAVARSYLRQWCGDVGSGACAQGRLAACTFVGWRCRRLCGLLDGAAYCRPAKQQGSAARKGVCVACWAVPGAVAT